MSDYFAPGNTVVFRAYAVDSKTRKVLTAKDVKYFYVKIPNQPNVKLTYNPKAPGASGQYTWTGTWTVPANYPFGTVDFKVLVKSKAKRLGSFVQMPVVTVTADDLDTRRHSRRRRARRGTAAPTARSTPSSTPTASTARAPRALRRGRSAARRRTSSSAVSSSCSAPGASTSRAAPSSRSTTSSTRTSRSPGAAQHRPQLGLARHDREGLLLDERLADPGRLPARQHRSCTSPSRLSSGKTATLDYPITIIPVPPTAGSESETRHEHHNTHEDRESRSPLLAGTWSCLLPAAARRPRRRR